MDRTQDVVHWFKDDKGDFRWHRTAPNGEIISESGEGYVDKDSCLEMAAAINPGIEIHEAHKD